MSHETLATIAGNKEWNLSPSLESINFGPRKLKSPFSLNFLAFPQVAILE